MAEFGLVNSVDFGVVSIVLADLGLGVFLFEVLASLGVVPVPVLFGAGLAVDGFKVELVVLGLVQEGPDLVIFVIRSSRIWTESSDKLTKSGNSTLPSVPPSLSK